MKVSVSGIDFALQIDEPVTDGPGIDSEQGSVVMLAHCFCANRDLWRYQVPALTGAGYTVLRHDARGHGETGSANGPYELVDMADDIAGLLDALEIEKVHLCGISMSGMIAQWFAIRHPQRLHSLTLCNTSSAYTPSQRAGWDERIAVLQEAGPESLIDAAMRRWFTAESLQSQVHGVEMIRAGFLSMDPAVRVALMRAIAYVNTTGRLHEISAPTLVVTGSEDVATPPSASGVLRAGIATSTLVTLMGAGHISPTERPDAFNEALLSFLSRRCD